MSTRPATPLAGGRYWLSDSQPEAEHLLAQAEMLAPDDKGTCTGPAAETLFDNYTAATNVTDGERLQRAGYHA